MKLYSGFLLVILDAAPQSLTGIVEAALDRSFRNTLYFGDLLYGKLVIVIENDYRALLFG